MNAWTIAVGNLQRVRSDYPPLHLFADDDESAETAAQKRAETVATNKAALRADVLRTFTACGPQAVPSLVTALGKGDHIVRSAVYGLLSDGLIVKLTGSQMRNYYGLAEQ